MYLDIREIYLLNLDFHDIPELKQITDAILIHKSYFLTHMSSRSINKNKIKVVPRRNISDRSTYTEDSAGLDDVIKKDNSSMKEIKNVVDEYLKNTQDQRDIEDRLNRSDSSLNIEKTNSMNEKTNSRNEKTKRDVSTGSISDKIKFFEQQIKLNGQ